MNCMDVYRSIVEELDEHLDDPSREAIKAHLQGCTNCTSVLESIRKTIALYRSQPDSLVPEKLTDHVLEVIRKSVQSSKPRPTKSPSQN